METSQTRGDRTSTFVVGSRLDERSGCTRAIEQHSHNTYDRGAGKDPQIRHIRFGRSMHGEN